MIKTLEELEHELPEEKLRKLYNTRKAECYKCGCALESHDSLGLFFVLDRQGRFYCAECDSEFADFDERIYEI